jgi:hypothetical protein
MDTLVKKIIETAKKEAPDAYTFQAALVRAGLIAQAYVGAEKELMEEAFGANSPLCAQEPHR